MSGKLTYKQSGVDTKEAAAFVSDISSHVKRTQKKRSLHQAFGLFAAAYDLSSYQEPVIVTGCDGVGTKTEILFELDMVETPPNTPECRSADGPFTMISAPARPRRP